MKQTSTQTFIIFGILLLILIAFASYFLIPTTSTRGVSETDRTSATTVEAEGSAETQADTQEANQAAVAGGFTLSENQVDALVSLGIDRASVPSTVSAEQETCFVETLGQDRVTEIKNGAVPSAIELMRAESCI